MPRQSTAKLTKAELIQEVSRLESRVAELEGRGVKEAKATAKHSYSWLNKTAMWLCLAIATAPLVVGNIFFWAGNTLVNTNKYVATVGPLIEKPEIQSAVAQYSTTQIFNNVNVQSYVQTVLPPKIDFLAPQLTSQLKSRTQSTLQNILASPKMHQYWYSSLARRHSALISFSKAYEGNGTIQVSDIYSQLSKQLAGTNLSFLANKTLPANVGSLTVATAGWLPVLHKIVTKIGLWQLLATLLFLGFSVFTIILAGKRRRAVIRLSIFYAVAMLLTLLAVRITRGLVVSHVSATYQPAVQVAYTTVFHPFVMQTTVILLLALLAVIVSWASGPYKSAVALRNRLTQLFSGKLHQAIFGTKENGFTKWVGKHKAVIEWTYVALIALIMLIVQLSPSLIVVYAILLLLGIIVTEVLAARNY